MQECDKLQIAEYNEGQLSDADLLAMEEHLKECSACSAYQRSNAKLGVFLQSWEETPELSKDFDINLLLKAQDLVTGEKRLSSIFSFAAKTAVAFCLILAVLAAYKNTLYDTGLQNLKAISKTELAAKTDIKDLKIFVTHRLCREMSKPLSDQKSLVNYECMLAVPENILLEEQKSDLRELLNEGVKYREADRNIVFNLLDGLVDKIEKSLKVEFSFAAGSLQTATLSYFYKKATLDFDNGKYESAFEGYKNSYGTEKDEKSLRSALFRMAFIKDLLNEREEASGYYKLVSFKYPLSAQALMSAEMNKFLKQKNSIEEKIGNLKKKKESPDVDFELAGLYLSLQRYESAAQCYERYAAKTFGIEAAHSRLNAGWCFKNTGNYREAAKMFAAVSPASKYKLLADYELSLTYFKMGDAAKAAAVSSSNDEIKEENYETYNTLIKKYFKAVNQGR